MRHEMRTPPGQGAALISFTTAAVGPNDYTPQAIFVQASAPILAAHWFRPTELREMMRDPDWLDEAIEHCLIHLGMGGTP